MNIKKLIVFTFMLGLAIGFTFDNASAGDPQRAQCRQSYKDDARSLASSAKSEFQSCRQSGNSKGSCKQAVKEQFRDQAVQLAQAIKSC